MELQAAEHDLVDQLAARGHDQRCLRAAALAPWAVEVMRPTDMRGDRLRYALPDVENFYTCGLTALKIFVLDD